MRAGASRAGARYGCHGSAPEARNSCKLLTTKMLTAVRGPHGLVGNRPRLPLSGRSSYGWAGSLGAVVRCMSAMFHVEHRRSKRSDPDSETTPPSPPGAAGSTGNMTTAIRLTKRRRLVARPVVGLRPLRGQRGPVAAARRAAWVPPFPCVRDRECSTWNIVWYQAATSRPVQASNTPTVNKAPVDCSFATLRSRTEGSQRVALC